MGAVAAVVIACSGGRLFAQQMLPAAASRAATPSVAASIATGRAATETLCAPDALRQAVLSVQANNANSREVWDGVAALLGTSARPPQEPERWTLTSGPATPARVIAQLMALSGQSCDSNEAVLQQETVAAAPSIPAAPQGEFDAVLFRDGLLSVAAGNVTLNALLRHVAAVMGSSLQDSAAGDARIQGVFAPQPAAELITNLLAGSGLDYILLSSAEDPNHLQQIIVMPRNAEAAALQPQQTPAPAPETVAPVLGGAPAPAAREVYLWDPQAIADRQRKKAATRTPQDQ